MRGKAPYDRKSKQDKSVLRSLLLITQFGINMLVPIGMMSWLGIWLDRKCGTSFFMVLFFFVGAAAGFQNIWRMARAVYEDEPEGGHGKQAGQNGAKSANNANRENNTDNSENIEKKAGGQKSHDR